MKATKGQAITTGVFAVLKILIAVVVFVLIKELLDAFLRIETSITEPGVFQWWIYGLPFMVPGILGVVAAGTRHQVAYGLYMAACIIACIVDAVFCVMSFAFLFAMAGVGGLNCEMEAGQCVCRSGLADIDTPTVLNGMNDCSDLNTMVHMSYGVTAMMIIGWLLCLSGSIISCVSCCCGKRDQGQVIVMGNYPGQVTVTTSNGPQYAIGPQYAGAQYMAPSAGSDNDENNQYKYNRMY